MAFEIDFNDIASVHLITTKEGDSMDHEELSAIGALNALPEKAKLSRSCVSRAIGRSNNFISNSINSRKVPSADLLSRIAIVCGFKLVLIPDNARIPYGSIVIEPSE